MDSMTIGATEATLKPDGQSETRTRMFLFHNTADRVRAESDAFAIVSRFVSRAAEIEVKRVKLNGVDKNLNPFKSL